MRTSLFGAGKRVEWGAPAQGISSAGNHMPPYPALPPCCFHPVHFLARRTLQPTYVQAARTNTAAMRLVLTDLWQMDMSGDLEADWKALQGHLSAQGARLPAADHHNMEATLKALADRPAGARWVVVVAGNCCHPIGDRYMTYGWRDQTGEYRGDAKSGADMRVRGWQAGVQCRTAARRT